MLPEDKPRPLSEFRHSIWIMLGLFFFVFISRLVITLVHPIEVGIDAAYYTINVLSLLSGGYLYYDAPIFAFAVAAFFSVLCGGNVIVGVKVASAFFAALLSVGMFFAAYTLSQGDWRVGAIAGILTAMDVSMLQLSTSLVKNEAALAFLPFAIAFLYRYFAYGHKPGDLGGFMLTGILTVLSHLMTVAWLFAAIIAFMGYEVLKYLKEHKGVKELGRLIIPLGLAGLCFLGVYSFFDFFIPAANTWYTSSSLMKAAYYSTDIEGINLILNIIGIAQPFIPETANIFEWFNIMYISAILILAVFGTIFLLKRNKLGDRMVIMLWAINILMGFILGGWLIRFQLMSFVPIYLILAMTLIPLTGILTKGVGSISRFLGANWKPKQSVQLGITLIVIVSLVGCTIPHFYWTGSQIIQPYVTASELESIEELDGQFSKNVLLYAPHGVNYFVTARTGYESPPDWGDSDWPIYCAKKMYRDFREQNQESYYLITNNQSPFIEYSLSNHYCNVSSPQKFDLIRDSFNLTVTADSLAERLHCYLRWVNDYSRVRYLTIERLVNKSWNTQIILENLPDGLYEVYIAPYNLSERRIENKQYWCGFYIYHFSSLPISHLSLTDLIYEVTGSGSYHVFGLNLTNAEQINLQDLKVDPHSLSTDQEFIQPYIFLFTPFFLIPYGILPNSNFFLILLLCPLNVIYIFTLSRTIGKGIKYMYIHHPTITSVFADANKSPNTMVPSPRSGSAYSHGMQLFLFR
jgi:hypothetical protein